ncbi:hypothetical protein [Telluria aromaticivorans]|uniref:Uncharacterized protein n=1 Tax=Telluria aromaticivorans TaxID=2725995 RepID=A0A7Y2JXR2_9BURK|nr:hypothetical protein [Telluria aromaticivorans]NNG22851.1 hypothetical protein [Telluria aromaticivorans]
MKDGMVQDDAVYRCIGLSCGRLTPRRVNFCPWCGTAQQVVQPGVSPPPVLAKAPVTPPRPVPAPPPAPPVVQPAAAAAAAAAAVPPPSPAPVPPPSARAAASATPPPAGDAGTGPGRGIPPPPGIRGAPMPARPPQRAPVRLRWWIAALVMLWVIWMVVKPDGSRVERRMDRAVALAVECKAREAQDELIALRGSSATPEQLRQVQSSLNKAAADCTRAEQRARAWTDTNGAVQKLRRARTYDKALARLAVFTRRWGEDDATRALRQEIIDEREHPLADPTRGE